MHDLFVKILDLEPVTICNSCRNNNIQHNMTMLVYKVSVISAAIFSFCALILAILVVVKVSENNSEDSGVETSTGSILNTTTLANIGIDDEDFSTGSGLD